MRIEEREGYRAYHEYQELTQNPYCDEDTESFESWQDGWIKAYEEDLLN